MLKCVMSNGTVVWRDHQLHDGGQLRSRQTNAFAGARTAGGSWLAFANHLIPL
jgi:hypothetical protein